MNLVLAGCLLLLLAAPAIAGPQNRVLHCDAQTSQIAAAAKYACAFELEPGRVQIVQWDVPITGIPWLSIRADYHAYTGPEGIMEPCITVQQIWLLDWGARVRVTNACEGEKYLIVELAVPR